MRKRHTNWLFQKNRRFHLITTPPPAPAPCDYLFNINIFTPVKRKINLIVLEGGWSCFFLAFHRSLLESLLMTEQKKSTLVLLLHCVLKAPCLPSNWWWCNPQHTEFFTHVLTSASAWQFFFFSFLSLSLKFMCKRHWNLLRLSWAGH